jgi:hypothetical protein
MTRIMEVMAARDDFSELTKQFLAFRASHTCSFSGCTQHTIGPSDESPIAYTNIGEAAHICAAAPGGRRHVVEMVSEERKHINIKSLLAKWASTRTNPYGAKDLLNSPPLFFWRSLKNRIDYEDHWDPVGDPFAGFRGPRIAASFCLVLPLTRPP